VYLAGATVPDFKVFALSTLADMVDFLRPN